MKVSDYVPIIYEDNLEMTELIDAEENELENNTKVSLMNAFNDNFSKNATINGIEKFEKLLNIQRDSDNDSVAYRRLKVITKLTTRAPLTYTWLKESLNGYIGANNYEIVLNEAEHDLLIRCSNIFDDTVTVLYNYYRPLIPANMSLRIAVAEQHDGTLYIGGIIHEGDTIYIEGEVDN